MMSQGVGMYKKFMIPSVVPADSDYKATEMEVEIFDEWGKLAKQEQDALKDLMTHYLQKRWDEQYKKVTHKEQSKILFALLKLLALEDLKKDIRYSVSHNKLGVLGKNILEAHARLNKDAMQREKVHPSMLASIPEGESPSPSLKM
jgi:hypothetical protein